MCRKYCLSFNTYMYETLKSLPPVSEGAYRNVWGDFDSPSDFSEFDDVIHCGEMLVRDMKRNGSIEELHHNRDRQILIPHTRNKHWKDLMGDLEKLLYAPSEQLLSALRLTAPAMESRLEGPLDFDRAFSRDKQQRGLVDYGDLEHFAARLLTD